MAKQNDQEKHEESVLDSDRLIIHEDLSPSKDPSQLHIAKRHCTGSTPPKSTSDISN